jgi:uncharacterized protein (DUF58 family)
MVIQAKSYVASSVVMVFCIESLFMFQFKKFTSPREIPTSFLEKHVTLTGKVVCVETSVGSSPVLLLVDHHPVVAWQLRQSATKCLPVHISSVDILNNGVSWLQHVVAGSNIRFTLLKANPESVSCIVNANTVSILCGFTQGACQLLFLWES